MTEVVDRAELLHHGRKKTGKAKIKRSVLAAKRRKAKSKAMGEAVADRFQAKQERNTLLRAKKVRPPPVVRLPRPPHSTVTPWPEIVQRKARQEY
jgi:hypothetical protein